MTNPTGKSTKYKVFIGILLTTTLIASAFAIYLFIQFNNQTTDSEATTITTYTSEEIDVIVDDAMEKANKEMLADLKSEFSTGTSTVSLLRKLYPENLVYYDTDKYIFASILSSVPKHNFATSGFKVATNGELTYSENGTIISHKGIDVSKFQGTIDWTKVKNTGVEFAMIRSGYRSYGKGVITDDGNFKQNVSGASNAGLDVGVYFFSQAITVTEAVEEADYVLSCINGYKVNYPVVVDIEEIANDTYRQENLTVKELTDICIAFCERIKAAGYTPMVYSNLKSYVANLDLTRLDAYEKWYAYYDTSLYFPYKISMWQYSDSGSVDGITGAVDLNISFKDWN